MLALPSSVEGKQYKLSVLEEKLKPLGYRIGGGWEYDHGYFDYKIDEQDGYTFLRVPFKAVDGELEQRGVTVELGQPFLLNHQYQEDLEEDADPFDGLFRMSYNSVVNQFQKPVDKDASLDPKFMPTARNLIQELELTLLY
ncbi:YugN-like family protein [Alkalihalobacillus oceani]|uniref:YugN-like family protein n=1 Tax=Halalkalibacter oceani TaxID=1653776 RepID=UPI00203CEA77|nr:YugN-like family protein [Halalkalibacter oceani]MCM3762538.1 YugN-like family protein [Halalkalibacter oceani]